MAPGLEGLEDLSAGKVDHRGLEAPQHFAAEARHSHLQADEIRQVVDFPVEPSTHLDPRVAHRERFQVEPRVELVPQFLPAPVAQPAVDLQGVEAEGDG